MKRTLLPPPMHRGYRFGAVLLAASLLAGPGLASPSGAVEPSPSAPATGTPATSAPAKLAPAGIRTPQPATTAPSPSPSIAPKSPAPSPAAAAPVPTTQALADPAPAAPATAAPATATAAPATAAPAAAAPAPDTFLDPSSPAAKAAMAKAIGFGGAEMGQRSARVAGSAAMAAGSRTLAQALTSEGTWTPSFGVQGMDVSGHQPTVNWQQQWNMGARFAYVKASEGNYFTNGSFNSQYQGSRSVGMIRGAYHFAIPNWSSGANQARFFVQNGGGWSADGATLPPVLDFEFNPYAGRTISGFDFGNTCYDMTPAQLRSWVHEFGNTMRSLTGRLPMIYTNTSWWRQCLGEPTTFAEYPLWVAAYPSAPTDNAGPVPASWGTYSMWQYSSTGPFAGDSNVWNGDYDALRRFAAGTADPVGSLDTVTLSRSGSEMSLRATGWAVDPAKPATAIQAHIYVTDPAGTTTGYEWQANKSRRDVDQAFGYGASHGFDGTIRITRSGTYKTCAYAIGSSGNTLLGCKTLEAGGTEAPRGAFDALGQSRTAEKVSLRLVGWAADPVNPGEPSFADAQVTDPAGKTTTYRMTADVSRPDVAAATGLGRAHGFDRLIEVSLPGRYRACVHAIGQNSNVLLSCRTITVDSNPSPIGAYDSLSVSQAPNSATFKVAGWALEPTRPAASIPVHIYVRSPDGTNHGYAFTANRSRPDVTRALGTVGNHGFDASVALTRPGSYTVCAYAIGAAPVTAGNSLLGCRPVTVGGTPATMGFLDSATLQGTGGQAAVKVTGWTLDPAYPAVSNPVHVYVTSPDGSRKGYAFTAGLSRPDVRNALVTVGNHGFSASVPVTQRGRYTVCAYGVAVSKLSVVNSLLGCRSLAY